MRKLHSNARAKSQVVAAAIAWRTAAVVGTLWITGALLGADTGTGRFKGGIQQTNPVRNPQPDRARPAQGKGEAAASATASPTLVIGA
jgi:hypothetical protein